MSLRAKSPTPRAPIAFNAGSPDLDLIEPGRPHQALLTQTLAVRPDRPAFSAGAFTEIRYDQRLIVRSVPRSGTIR